MLIWSNQVADFSSSDSISGWSKSLAISTGVRSPIFIPMSAPYFTNISTISLWPEGQSFDYTIIYLLTISSIAWIVVKLMKVKFLANHLKECSSWINSVRSSGKLCLSWCKRKTILEINTLHIQFIIVCS